MTFQPLTTMLSSALLVMSLFSSMVTAHADHHHDEYSEIIVNNAQVRVFLPASKSTVGYLSIINHGDADVILTKAAIDGLGRVEIHEHAHIDGMMKMQKVDTLLIKAHQQLDFKPGGYHLMAFEPSEVIKAGQELKLTLYFSDGNRVFTQAQVVSLESQVEQTTQSQQHHTHH